ncbi:ankyrin [Westerdykella ornata]|uniref:Ankyrin n=1 Tax=Westerdykella ornata TaxID=318751 RepID=A0A6A6JCR0_WESOR|nr:ankyrin [Westerdykella ornata]KAF2274410.1 ankyrin [Westerdykella ornata]
MQLLELPSDVFKLVITFMVRELGLTQSMKARRTCRTFADEIFDAVITTRVIEEVTEGYLMQWRLAHHPEVIARYLYHRVRTDGSATHPWITTIRETSQMLAQHTGSENDFARVELLERNMCLCLAVNAGPRIFSVLKGEDEDGKTQLEGGTWANCLAIAAWIGDKTLVESLNRGSDPPSFFGSPSWAAAAQAHVDILQLFLDQGALPYDPTSSPFSTPYYDLSRGPLPVAAYMGRENIVRLLLEPPYYCSEIQDDEKMSICYAAEGNHPTLLKLLLEHYKRNSTPQEFLAVINHGLVCSCRCGVQIPAKIFVDYGADVNASDSSANSCLQLAARTGNAAVVKMLLDAGASLKAESIVHRHISSRVTHRQRQKDPLWQARRLGYTEVIRLLENKQRELLERGS